MEKDNKSNGKWWKILITLTFIISLICLYILVQPNLPNLPNYEYKTKLIELHNTNDYSFVDGRIVNYVCDEGVIFHNRKTSYYASTWSEDSNRNEVEPKYRGMAGRCMIKIRKWV